LAKRAATRTDVAPAETTDASEYWSAGLAEPRAIPASAPLNAAKLRIPILAPFNWLSVLTSGLLTKTSSVFGMDTEKAFTFKPFCAASSPDRGDTSATSTWPVATAPSAIVVEPACTVSTLAPHWRRRPSACASTISLAARSPV